MIYSLDTNTCIRYINGRVPLLMERIQATPVEDIIVCSVVRAELYAGSAKSQTRKVTRAKQLDFLQPYETLPFDDHAALLYGDIRAVLEKSGQTIGAHDIMIAAIALAHDLILVTHNIKHYSRVPGLRYEDWEEET